MPPAAPLRLRFYATAREAVGRPTATRDIAPAGMPVGEIVDALAVEWPRLAPILRTARLVLNGEYLPPRDRTTRVRPGDELAVHPPYSGG